MCTHWNGSYALNKMYLPTLIIAVHQWIKCYHCNSEYFNMSAQNRSFTAANWCWKPCGRDECVLDGWYEGDVENGTCGTFDLQYHHYLVPNDCFKSASNNNYNSTGYVCVDDNTLFQIFYNDNSCSSPVDSDLLAESMMVNVIWWILFGF